jgi:hypothetical protein
LSGKERSWKKCPSMKTKTGKNFNKEQVFRILQRKQKARDQH